MTPEELAKILVRQWTPSHIERYNAFFLVEDIAHVIEDAIAEQKKKDIALVDKLAEEYRSNNYYNEHVIHFAIDLVKRIRQGE